MLSVDYIIAAEKSQAPIVAMSVSVRSFLICARFTPHVIHPSVPLINHFCCERCRVRLPEFCCDICHPNHYKHPFAEPSDKAPRAKNRHNPKPYTRGPPEMSLHAALVDMRQTLAS